MTSRRGQGGGPAPRVDAERWERWREDLQGQQTQHWTSEQLSETFEHLTGVRYSPGYWCSLLRRQQGMYYYKPRPRDYRRPDDAQQQLAQRIRATFDGLLAMGYQPQQVGWGLADEVAAQLHSNNARFWAFDRTAEAAAPEPHSQHRPWQPEFLRLLRRQRPEPLGRAGRWQGRVHKAGTDGG